VCNQESSSSVWSGPAARIGATRGGLSRKHFEPEGGMNPEKIQALARYLARHTKAARSRCGGGCRHDRRPSTDTRLFVSAGLRFRSTISSNRVDWADVDQSGLGSTTAGIRTTAATCFETRSATNTLLPWLLGALPDGREGSDYGDLVSADR